jgi:hypothetical protein
MCSQSVAIYLVQLREGPAAAAENGDGAAADGGGQAVLLVPRGEERGGFFLPLVVDGRPDVRLQRVHESEPAAEGGRAEGGGGWCLSCYCSPGERVQRATGDRWGH